MADIAFVGVEVRVRLRDGSTSYDLSSWIMGNKCCWAQWGSITSLGGDLIVGFVFLYLGVEWFFFLVFFYLTLSFVFLEVIIDI